MKIIVLTVVLLVVGSLAAFLLRRDRNEGAPVQPSQVETPAVEAGATALAAPTPDEKKSTDDKLAPAGVEALRTGAAAPEPNAPQKELVGRVQVAAGCGDDDRIEVFALGFEGSLQVLDWNIDAKDQEKSSILARASVKSDGTFKLALPADKERVFLLVRGRYAYTLESTAVRVGAAQPVVIVAECGGAISGTVSPPPGLEALGPKLESLEVKLSTSLEGGTGDLTGMGRTNRTVKVHDGRFEIDALDPRTGYDLELSPEVLAAANVTVTGLAVGRTKTVDVVLQRGGTLNGIVKGPDGAPVSGAKVEAKRKGHFFGFDDEVVRSAQSDKDGAFELAAVWPGHVLLSASASGMLDGDPVAVDIADGAARNGVVLTLGQGKSIAGTVAWADGKPAAGVDVEVDFDKSQMAGMTAFNAARGAEGKAKTDGAGAFVVAGLGAGPFTVKVQALAPEDVATYADADKKTRAEHQQRARKDGVKPDTKDLKLVLAAPQGVRGKVVDATAKPIAAFHVRAASVGTGLLANVGQDEVEKDVKDETGAFLLSIPRDGAWKITVESEGYAGSLPLDIKLPLAADAAPLVITLEKAATVRGVVQDPHGVPVAGASVTTSNGEPNWKRVMSGLEEPKAKSNTDGTFVLEGLHGGHVALVAEAKAWARSAETGFDLAAGETREGVVLVLREGGKLTGEVYDGGKAASGMLVQATLLKTYDQKAGMSDGQGRFEFAHLEPGAYQVVAMPTSALAGKDDGSGVDQAAIMAKLKMSSATIADGQETHVVLGAPPQDPVKVHGRVTHAGAPFTGAMVMFIAEGKNVLQSMKTASVGSDGTYSIEIDGPGKFGVTVQRLGGKPGEQSSIEFRETIPAVKEHELDFAMPTARISGSVRGADGAAADGVMIMLQSEGGLATGTMFGGQFHMSSADGEGRFDLDVLRAGTYVVSAGGSSFGGMDGSEAAHARQSAVVHVSEGEWRKDVSLRLEKPGTVIVTVVDESGAPVAGAAVFARDAEGRLVDMLSMLTTAGDGTVKYAGLGPGRHTFSARTKDHASAQSGAIDVESGGVKTAKITLLPGTVLTVRVLDSEANPTSAFLTVTDEGGRDVAAMMSMADITERFTGEGAGFSGDESRVGPLAPGKYRVKATRADGKSTEKSVTLAGKAEEKVKLRFAD